MPAQIKKLKKRAFLLLLFLFLLSSIFLKPIYGFNSGPDSTYPFRFKQAVFDNPEEMNLQSFVYETMRAAGMSIVTLITGNLSQYDPYIEEYKKILEEARETGSASPSQIQEKLLTLDPPKDSALFQLSYFIASTYANPPASGIQYLADIGQKINLVKPVYAQQGIGWATFNYALPIWRAFRNISYIFFALILVFIGFAIMFRVKISPQTVITIQNALPKIILSLVLVTFSYAIAGFMVDIMYILLNLFFAIFKPFFSGKSFWSWLTSFYPTTSAPLIFITMLTVGLIPIVLNLLSIVIFGVIESLAIGLLPSVPLLPLLTGISVVWTVIVIVALFLALIRICWILLKAYINVLLAIIFGPFQILVGALPGNNAIESWFRNLIANILVWPTVFAMILTASLVSLSIFSPPYNKLSLFFLPIVSLGILLLTPKATDIIQAFLTSKPFAYGTAIGQPIAAAQGIVFYPVREGTGVVIRGTEKAATDIIAKRAETILKPPEKSTP
jgi:hypothetical protein